MENFILNLINVDGAKDVLIHFLDKLSNGIGWIANKETSKSIAENTYIKEIQNGNFDPLTKAALISNSGKIIKEYTNQSDIVKNAIQYIECSAKPEKMEDDWLAQFMDKAKLVSSKEFQVIWGKVLARECNEPGSIPRTLLYILSQMEREEAETFTTLCKMTVSVEEDSAPVIIASRWSEYGKFGITFDRIVNLKALGLIEMNIDEFFPGYALEASTTPSKVLYFSKEHEFSGSSISIGNVVFTKAGIALLKSIVVEEMPGFWEEYCLPYFESTTTEEK